MPESVSVSAAVRLFLAWLEPRAAATTVKWYRGFLEPFAAQVAAKPLGDVRRLDVETFAVRRHPLYAVCRFLRWCHEVAELLPFNPAGNVKIPRCGRRMRTLGRAERVIIRRNARKSLYRAILAMEESGFRPQECRNARFEMIRSIGSGADLAADLRRGLCYFQFDEFKSKERRRGAELPRVVPISPRLGRLLERLLRRRSSREGPVFLSCRGRPWTVNGMRCAFRRLRAKLQAAGRVNVAGLVAYCYRHTVGTDLATAGVNAFGIRDWLGHCDVKTTATYCHSTVNSLMDLAGKKWKKERPAK